MTLLERLDAGIAEVKNLDQTDVRALLTEAKREIVTLTMVCDDLLAILNGADPNHL